VLARLKNEIRARLENVKKSDVTFGGIVDENRCFFSVHSRNLR